MNQVMLALCNFYKNQKKTLNIFDYINVPEKQRKVFLCQRLLEVVRRLNGQDSNPEPGWDSLRLIYLLEEYFGEALTDEEWEPAIANVLEVFRGYRNARSSNLFGSATPNPYSPTLPTIPGKMAQLFWEAGLKHDLKQLGFLHDEVRLQELPELGDVSETRSLALRYFLSICVDAFEEVRVLPDSEEKRKIANSPFVLMGQQIRESGNGV